MALLSVRNAARLRDGYASTLLGRMVTHPGVGGACRVLAEVLKPKLEEAWAPFVAATGKSPLELLALLRGEVTLAVAGISPAGVPQAALAIELGESRADILAVVARLRALAEESSGAKLETLAIGSIEATLWPAPFGQVAVAVLGDHLVLTSDPEFLGSLAEAHAAGAPGEGKPAGVIGPALAKRLSLGSEEVLALCDVARIRETFLGPGGMPPDEEGRTIFRFIGLDGVSSIAFALGFRDGGPEWTAHIGVQEGTKGILGIIRDNLLPLGDPAPAFGRMPERPDEVQAVRIAPGRILGQIDALLRSEEIGLASELDEAYGAMERAVGISFQKDLATLGEISLWGYTIAPRAGGLLPDQVILVKAEELAPYRRVGEKLLAAGGFPLAKLETKGAPIEYVDLTAVGRRVLPKLLGGEEPGEETATLLVASFLAAGLTPARMDLGDGWMAVSAIPQALVRRASFGGAGRFSGASEAPIAAYRADAAKAVSGASVAAVWRSGRGILWLHNTAIAFAAAYAPVLGAFGVDPARLPPAEEFEPYLGNGHLRIECGPDGLALKGYRTLESTSATLVAVGGGAAVAAGFLVPALMRGRGEAYKLQCANNLKQLFLAGIEQADTSGTKTFPFSPEGSLASLQMLVDSDPAGLSPQLFVCPEGHETPAVRGPDGSYMLTEETCSYEIVARRMRNTVADQILIYDKRPHHRLGRGSGRSVVFTDGSVRFLLEEEFQQLLPARWGEDGKAPEQPAPEVRKAPTKAKAVKVGPRKTTKKAEPESRIPKE
jgi:hypothetical protein